MYKYWISDYQQGIHHLGKSQCECQSPLYPMTGFYNMIVEVSAKK
jgi:hypothetical protein